MSSSAAKSPRAEDSISTEDDTPGSSASLSIGENSRRVKERPKLADECDSSLAERRNASEKWWLRRPETRLGPLSARNADATSKQSPVPSSDVSSSMREFLEREKLCRVTDKAATPKSEGEIKERDDTLCDILASAAFDKYPSDFENATDEDIGSILEEMSKIAGALSPNSGPEHGRSDGKDPNEEEKSVEELLEEAERLVKKNSNTLSKSSSKSDTLIPDGNEDQSLGRVRQLEADIFQLIEEEVHKETEKIKRSPKIEKRRENSPGIEIVYENVNSLKAPKSLELQRRRFEEQKVEISSSSDLDDPIERHSKSEELRSAKKAEMENLQKEITDVDKDFFEDLLRKSKEKADGGGMSGSSSFGQEDFSHFLKLLQGQQSDKKEREPLEADAVYDLFLRSANRDVARIAGDELTNGETPEFPEKEFTEILAEGLAMADGGALCVQHEINESDSSECRSRRAPDSPPMVATILKSASNESFKRSRGECDKKSVNCKDELYTVGLTPRLELFADAIPKLMAEKLSEDVAREEKATWQEPITTKCAEQPKAPRANHREAAEGAAKATNARKRDRANDEACDKGSKKEIRFGKSKSYDQICQPPLRTSLENIRVNRALSVSRKPVSTVARRSMPLKPSVQPRSVPKVLPRPSASTRPRMDPAKAGSTSSLPAACKAAQPRSPSDGCSGRADPLAAGDSRQTSRRDWEVLCHEERHKNVLLKQQLEAEARLYRCQIDDMRATFEADLFALRKQNIILKARVDELSLNDRRPEPRTTSGDARVALLERELEKQERLLRAYETENKKLMLDTKRVQEETKKALLTKQRSEGARANDAPQQQQLADRVKDLQEGALKLNLELSELRERNADCLLRNDDLTQQNGLLADELEMFKEQLRTKNVFITDRLQAMTSAELELKKQIEELSIKLGSKTEQLRMTRLELEKHQRDALPLERELLEARVREESLQEKLRIGKGHVEREKQLSQRLKDQVVVDSKKIMDLNRQVREMERILKRKNPDSVSALILTANAEQERIGGEKVRLLEERIACLENETRAKEATARQSLADLQRKFGEMKDRYVAQVTELETRLSEADAKQRRSCSDAFTQTTAQVKQQPENKLAEGGCRREDREERKDAKAARAAPKSQNPKEDAHLIATIRGLKLEMANKEKAATRMTKEYQELQKTNRRLQKEREKLLNDRKSFRTLEADRLLVQQRPRNGDTNDQNSNVYQNGHATETRLSVSTSRLYDPLQYTENGKSGAMKRLTNENDILREELGKINKDFMALKSKRLHDLNLLQEEHEREIAALVKEYSVKFGDSKAVKLQGQVNTQGAIISHLKEQLEKFRDYKEQVVVLKTEREHLESRVKSLTEKVKYLSTPGTEQLQLLQDKITILQQRHESREMSLQTLVRDLLRNRTQCKDCRNEKGKNRQLCYFKQELDHILELLQGIANVH